MPLSRADERVLFTLKTSGAMTARKLSEKLSITVVAVRKQLARLEEARLVSYRETTSGPGRPERLWRLTPEGHDRFPDTHSELTLELLTSIRHVFGEKGLDRLIAAREDATRNAYAVEIRRARTLEQRVGILADLRRREGYMAEVQQADNGAFLLVENHCPICAAASACQGFCRSELSIFRTVLGPDVRVSRTEHILAGARRCAYRIEPKGTPREGAS